MKKLLLALLLLPTTGWAQITPYVTDLPSLNEYSIGVRAMKPLFIVDGTETNPGLAFWNNQNAGLAWGENTSWSVTDAMDFIYNGNTVAQFYQASGGEYFFEIRNPLDSEGYDNRMARFRGDVNKSELYLYAPDDAAGTVRWTGTGTSSTWTMGSAPDGTAPVFTLIGNTTSPTFRMSENQATYYLNVTLADLTATRSVVFQDAAGKIEVQQASEPTCSATTQGQIALVAGGAGVADTYRVCVKSAADTYSWTDLMGGGGSVGLDDGLVTAPSLYFNNDPLMGMFRVPDGSNLYNQWHFTRDSTTNAPAGWIARFRTRDTGAGATRQYFELYDPSATTQYGAAVGYTSFQSLEQTDQTVYFQYQFDNTGSDYYTVQVGGTAATIPGVLVSLYGTDDGDTNQIQIYTTDSVTGDSKDVEGRIRFWDNAGAHYQDIRGPSDPSGTGVITVPNATGTMSYTVASGATTFDPASTSTGTCATAITGTATGTLTTDVISWTFSADPTSTTGYDPSGDLGYIVAYPTANTVNFKFCNASGTAIDPGSVTLNWRVDR